MIRSGAHRACGRITPRSTRAHPRSGTLGCDRHRGRGHCLGTAVDAAARGYTTLLLEAHDFAKGTSSPSTKLIHGGVRYLAQGNISLVYDALRDRGRLRRNAPHLVHTLPFVVPAYTWWAQPYYGAGLLLYSLLAGSLGLGTSRIISRAEALRLAPTLEPHGLRGGVAYYDAQFDDARLSIALPRALLDLGGVALNYAPVTSLIKTSSRVSCVLARDTETNEELEITAHAAINATGVYADELRRIDNPQAQPLLAPSQGVHLVLDRAFLPGDHANMIARTNDGRVLVAVLWHDRVIVGTTDTPRDSTSIEPRPARGDRLSSQPRRALPPQGSRPGGCIERLCRSPPACQGQRRRKHRIALARPHADRRGVRADHYHGW